MSAPRNDTISFRSHVARGEHGEPTPREYEILAPAGAGAMGVVYLARHLALDRAVALKSIGPRVSGDPDAMARFLQEGRATSLLRHENTVQVLDFGGDASGAYLVMEYLDGTNLADLLEAEGPLTPTRAIHIAAQVLAGLGAAHDLGIVHRDVKPSNVMLVASTDDDGEPIELVKVFDFGIATVGQSAPLAAHGEVIGTPDYMSPEQAQGLLVDARSDVYAVGIMLYAMLSGDVPFPFDSPMETVLAHVKDTPRPLRERAPHISEELESAVMQALNKRPSDRPQSARAFRTNLLAVPEAPDTTRVLHAVPAPATPVPVVQAPASQGTGRTLAATSRRGPPRWLLAVALLAVMAFGGWVIAGALEQPAVAQMGAGAALLPLSTPAAPRIEDPPRAAVVVTAPAPSSPSLPTQLPPSLPALPAEVAETDVPVATTPATTVATTPITIDKKEADKKLAAKAAKEKAARELAAKEQLARDQAAMEQAAKAQALKDQAAKDQVAKAQVAKEQAAKDQVAKEQAAKEAATQAPARPTFAAHASVAGLAIDGSLPRSSVARALESVRGALEGCYADASRAADRDAATGAAVKLEIDVDGRARSVAVGALTLPGLAACATSALGRIRLKDRPDTGTVLATFHLAFAPRSP